MPGNVHIVEKLRSTYENVINRNSDTPYSLKLSSCTNVKFKAVEITQKAISYQHTAFQHCHCFHKLEIGILILACVATALTFTHLIL